MHTSDNYKQRLKLGIIILLVLAILTAIEYVMGVAMLPAFLLIIVALAKAVLVIWFFMHFASFINTMTGKE